MSKRHSVTLSPKFVKALKILVEDGTFQDEPTAIREALRSLFEKHGIEGFSQLPPGDPRTLISEAIEMLEEVLKRNRD